MPSGASSASVGIGRASSGRGPSPPRQRAHAATVGQLVRVAAEPTTRPKCPAGSATSYSSARDAARRIARTLGAGAISSTSPTKARIGRSMSASVTSRSSTMKPPSSIRLWATNWRMKSASAGPGQATQPSASRKRRWRSRGSSASRSCRASTKASCWRSDFTGSRSRKPARLAQAGSHSAREGARGDQLGHADGELLGHAERDGRARVDRGAEGHERVDALAAAVGGGLVGEHAALRVAAEHDVAAGELAHAVHRLADRAHVVGQRAREPALLALGRAEVDDQGLARRGR